MGGIFLVNCRLVATSRSSKCARPSSRTQNPTNNPPDGPHDPRGGACAAAHGVRVAAVARRLVVGAGAQGVRAARRCGRGRGAAADAGAQRARGAEGRPRGERARGRAGVRARHRAGARPRSARRGPAARAGRARGDEQRGAGAARFSRPLGAAAAASGASATAAAAAARDVASATAQATRASGLSARDLLDDNTFNPNVPTARWAASAVARANNRWPGAAAARRAPALGAAAAAAHHGAEAVPPVGRRQEGRPRVDVVPQDEGGARRAVGEARGGEGEREGAAAPRGHPRALQLAKMKEEAEGRAPRDSARRLGAQSLGAQFLGAQLGARFSLTMTHPSPLLSGALGGAPSAAQEAAGGAREEGPGDRAAVARRRTGPEPKEEPKPAPFKATPVPLAVSDDAVARDAAARRRTRREDRDRCAAACSRWRACRRGWRRTRTRSRASGGKRCRRSRPSPRRTPRSRRRSPTTSPTSSKKQRQFAAMLEHRKQAARMQIDAEEGGEAVRLPHRRADGAGRRQRRRSRAGTRSTSALDQRRDDLFLPELSRRRTSRRRAEVKLSQEGAPARRAPLTPASAAPETTDSAELRRAAVSRRALRQQQKDRTARRATRRSGRAVMKATAVRSRAASGAASARSRCARRRVSRRRRRSGGRRSATTAWRRSGGRSALKAKMEAKPLMRESKTAERERARAEEPPVRGRSSLRARATCSAPRVRRGREGRRRGRGWAEGGGRCLRARDARAWPRRGRGSFDKNLGLAEAAHVLSGRQPRPCADARRLRPLVRGPHTKPII